MRQIGFFEYEQHFAQRASEALKQMTELEQLRELVRLAEADRALPEGLARSPVKPARARPLTTTGRG